MLSIAMIHALYYVSQHTTTLLKALPFACYLISVIRGQWIQAKVLPQHISKQKPCTPCKSLFQMKHKLGFASHIAQESKFLKVSFVGVFAEEISEPLLQKRLWFRCCDSQRHNVVTGFQRKLCWAILEIPLVLIAVVKLPRAPAKTCSHMRLHTS